MRKWRGLSSRAAAVLLTASVCMSPLASVQPVMAAEAEETAAEDMQEQTNSDGADLETETSGAEIETGNPEEEQTDDFGGEVETEEPDGGDLTDPPEEGSEQEAGQPETEEQAPEADSFEDETDEQEDAASEALTEEEDTAEDAGATSEWLEDYACYPAGDILYLADYQGTDTAITVQGHATYEDKEYTVGLSGGMNIWLQADITSVKLENGVYILDGDYLFEGSESLTSADLSGAVWSTEAESMSSMFQGCSSLTSVKLGSGAPAIVDMADMFYNCESLTSVDLSSLDLSCVDNMNDMFNGCSSLTSVNFGSTSSRALQDISGMFEDCTSLTSMNLNSLNTRGLVSLDSLFQGCESLKEVDMSSCRMDSLTGSSNVFGDCPALQTIKAPVNLESEAALEEDFVGAQDGKLYTALPLNSSSSITLVKLIPLTSMKLDKSSEAIEIGDTFRIKAEVGPSNANYKTIVWSSSDPKIASVDQNGNVKGLAKGTTQIRCNYTTRASTLEKTVTVKVMPVLKSLSVSSNKSFIPLDGTAQMYAVASPDGADTSVTWESSDPTIATVDSKGIATGKKIGKVTITATSKRHPGIKASKTFEIMMEAPEFTRVGNRVEGIEMHWKHADGAKKYAVFYCPKGGSWKRLTTTTALTYTWKGAKDGTTYYFTVRSCDSNGKVQSPSSKAVTLTRYGTPEITSMTNESTGIRIKWTKINGAPKYGIYCKPQNSDWFRAAVVSGSSTSYLYTKVETGKNYSFTVRVLDSNSKCVSDTRVAKTHKFWAPPKLLTLTKTSKGITLKWNKASASPKYAIYYCPKGGSWKRLATVGGNTYTYTFTGAKSGTLYYFTVRAVDSNGKTVLSASSNCKSIRK